MQRCWKVQSLLDLEVYADKKDLGLVQSYLFSLLEIVSALCFHCDRPRYCLRQHHLASAKILGTYPNLSSTDVWLSVLESILAQLHLATDTAQMIKGTLLNPKELSYNKGQNTIYTMQIWLCLQFCYYYGPPPTETASCVWRRMCIQGQGKRKGLLPIMFCCRARAEPRSWRR